MCVCVFQIEESQRDITEREKHLAKLQEQEKALTLSFTNSIADNNKFKDFILKVRYLFIMNHASLYCMLSLHDAIYHCTACWL